MGIIYKKYLYSGAISLIAVFTLSACAKQKLDAKLSVNNIIYMSRRGLKLKVDQTLVEASFKLENISEDMKNELKTSAMVKKSQQVRLTKMTYLFSSTKIIT